MRYIVVVERGETSWGAHEPDLPGCIAVGETRDEALELIREAIELHIEGLRRDGLTVPAPSSESELVEYGGARGPTRLRGRTRPTYGSTLPALGGR
jgi:predicted RNase H-like HicB family nuclease